MRVQARVPGTGLFAGPGGWRPLFGARRGRPVAGERCSRPGRTGARRPGWWSTSPRDTWTWKEFALVLGSRIAATAGGHAEREHFRSQVEHAVATGDETTARIKRKVHARFLAGSQLQFDKGAAGDRRRRPGRRARLARSVAEEPGQAGTVRCVGPRRAAATAGRNRRQHRGNAGAHRQTVTAPSTPEPRSGGAPQGQPLRTARLATSSRSWSRSSRTCSSCPSGSSSSRSWSRSRRPPAS